MSEHNQTQSFKIGRSMIWLMWLLVIILMTLFFNKIIEDQHNPNKNIISSVNNDGDKQVSLIRNRSGHYITNGKINNTEVVFIIDTGASDISIPIAIADQLGLKKGREVYYETANGNAISYQTRLKNVSIGNIRVDNVKASINPNTSFNEILLGMSFLKNIEFTQRGNILILNQYK